MLKSLKNKGMRISTINKSRLVTNVHSSDSKMIVLLEAGRELSVPLEWFKRLWDAIFLLTLPAFFNDSQKERINQTESP